MIDCAARDLVKGFSTVRVSVRVAEWVPEAMANRDHEGSKPAKCLERVVLLQLLFPPEKFAVRASVAQNAQSIQATN